MPDLFIFVFDLVNALSVLFICIYSLLAVIQIVAKNPNPVFDFNKINYLSKCSVVVLFVCLCIKLLVVLCLYFIK